MTAIGGLQPAAVTIPLGGPATWGTALDTQELARHVAWCKSSASSTKDKGDRLQALATWLLAHLSGFRAQEANVYSEDGAQEIDVAFWNEQRQDGFPSFDSRVLVECKNWTRPVDSSDVAWFDWKMRLGGSRDGILIAANGITTKSKRREAAVGILTAANADAAPRKIYVVTLDDIARLTSTEDLRNLLIHKAMGLTLRSPFA